MDCGDEGSRAGSKKKALASSNRKLKYQSAFKTYNSHHDHTDRSFKNTQSIRSSQAMELGSDWDIACRYQDLRDLDLSREEIARLRSVSAQAVIERAQQVIGAISHPRRQVTLSLDQVSYLEEEYEVDLDSTFEESPLLGQVGQLVRLEAIWVTLRQKRNFPLVICVDTSLSMTGEKLALTAVAIAVVLLQFPDESISIVAFENRAEVLKRSDEKLSIPQLLQRFLDVPAKGYTHLESGLVEALNQTQAITRRDARLRPCTILLTDGKYTAGKDPAYLASRFLNLSVLKMGQDRSSRELCRELAQRGGGSLKEISDLKEMPQAMYGFVKELIRVN